VIWKQCNIPTAILKEERNFFSSLWMCLRQRLLNPMPSTQVRVTTIQKSTHFEENGARFTAPPESPLATFVATEAPGVKAFAPVETHTASASTTKTLFMVVMLLSRSRIVVPDRQGYVFACVVLMCRSQYPLDREGADFNLRHDKSRASKIAPAKCV
jgi:hypothetical protein